MNGDIMKRIFVVLIIVSILASCVTSPKAEPTLSEGQRIQKSNELTNQARNKLDQNQNGEGLDLANKALEFDPENGAAYLQQGRAYKNLNKTPKALSSFDMALKYSGEANEILINIGMCYRDTGNIAKAKENFDKALAKSPNDGWANREIRNLYNWQLNDCKKALEHYLIAVAQGNNDPWIYNDMSIAYEKSGNMEKAREFINLAKARIDAGQGDEYIKRQVAERILALK